MKDSNAAVIASKGIEEDSKLAYIFGLTDAISVYGTGS